MLPSCAMNKNNKFHFENYDMGNSEQEAERMRQDLLRLHPIGSSVEELGMTIIEGGGKEWFKLSVTKNRSLLKINKQQISRMGREIVEILDTDSRYIIKHKAIGEKTFFYHEKVNSDIFRWNIFLKYENNILKNIIIKTFEPTIK